VAFFDAETCDQLIQDLRGVDGKLPDFESVGSDPGSPPPALEAEVAHGERATQTSPVPTHDQSTDTLTTTVSTSDQSTQVLSRPHQATSGTQTPSLALTSEHGTQVLFRPPRSVAYTQTAIPARSTNTSWSQTYRAPLTDTGTDMPPVLVTSTGCQAGSHFDNEVILPGAPRSKLPWAYSYAQFDALLTAYPDVHPEDFVTFGKLQAQPRQGSYTEWGASVLAHMVGGKRTLANELYVMIRRIQRLDRADPMRATEEEALVAVVMRERRRLGMPLREGAYATLAAPGGPLAHAAPPRDPRHCPSTSDP